MKVRLSVIFLMLVILTLSVSSLFAQGKLLKRVAQQADKVSAAYAETWNTFYGDGYYKTLMNAALDTRPDGTPNIVLNEMDGTMEITIRLSVNEPNYNAWKEKAHARFKAANMSYTFSDFEDTEGRMIGGKNYKFGANEEQSIRRWEGKETNLYKAKLTIHVSLVDEKKRVLRERYVPLESFQRLGFLTYPIPLHNLNRLKELPRSRFHWFDTDKEPTTDLHIEDGYVRIPFAHVSTKEKNAFDDVQCVILDAVDLKKELYQAGLTDHEKEQERERMLLEKLPLQVREEKIKEQDELLCHLKEQIDSSVTNGVYGEIEREVLERLTENGLRGAKQAVTRDVLCEIIDGKISGAGFDADEGEKWAKAKKAVEKL